MSKKAKAGRLDVLRDCTDGIHGVWTLCLCLLTEEDQEKSRKLLLFQSGSDSAFSRKPFLEFKIEQLTDAANTPLPFGFSILLSKDYEGPTPAFRGSSIEDRDSWVKAIKRAITISKAKRRAERDHDAPDTDTFYDAGVFSTRAVILDSPRARELGIVGCEGELLVSPEGYIGLQLEELIITHWFLRQIRRYRVNKPQRVFRFEAGSKARYGEGWWIFQSQSAETLYAKIKECEANIARTASQPSTEATDRTACALDHMSEKSMRKSYQKLVTDSSSSTYETRDYVRLVQNQEGTREHPSPPADVHDTETTGTQC